jgi:hypothetical protein
MKEFVVMRFDKSDEIINFLLKHKNLELYDKANKKFLIVETEKDQEPKFKKRIVARFKSKDNKLFIDSLDKYESLSENAKRIIDYIRLTEDKSIILKIGESIDGVYIDRNLYYEVFHFATDIGMNYCRYNVEGVEEIEIYMKPEDILCF